MTPRDDGIKAALLERIRLELAGLLKADGKGGQSVPEPLLRLAERVFAHNDVRELEKRGAVHLARAVMVLWQQLHKREPGQLLLRLFQPQGHEFGWSAPVFVLTAINDDMPFLVDSLTALLQREGLEIKLLAHPMFRVTRDASGRLQDLGQAVGETAGSTEDDAIRQESVIYAEIRRSAVLQEAKTADEVVERIRTMFADVRAAVEDWQAMRSTCRNVIAGLTATGPSVEIGHEVEAFLGWVADNNFTFLGYRYYALTGSKEAPDFDVSADKGLGVLRDPQASVFDGLRRINELPLSARELLLGGDALFITKSSRPATVHRPVPMDAILVKDFDPDGQMRGEHLFLGLFTSGAYSRSAREIPYLREKVARTLKKAGLPQASHSGKALAHILDTYPRDELFQIGEDTLLDVATGVMQLAQQPRVALFTRRDPFDRSLSCLVYVPRDRFDSDLRRQMQDCLEDAFSGELNSFFVNLDETALARVHFVLSLDRAHDGSSLELPDPRLIEERLNELARSWEDRLRDALVERHGEELAEPLIDRFERGFPAGYRERETALQAINDIEAIGRLGADGTPVVQLYRPHGADPDHVHFRLISPKGPVHLSDVLPVLENLGLDIVSERPYEIQPSGSTETIWIHDYQGLAAGLPHDAMDRRRDLFETAFLRAWGRALEDDELNRLVLVAGLDWREVTMLRAYARFLQQANFSLSQAAIAGALFRHTALTRDLVKLFHAQHDPSKEARESEVGGILVALDHALEAVTSLDDDRVIRALIALIRHSLRTNFYQTGANGEPRPFLTFKLESQQLDFLPAPRPFREIFVYSLRVEGVHLRGGMVARGGIRWSDRPEDFRTEVLGLMKAQMVKNAVIVPVGAKGGFVMRQPPSEGGREARNAEGVACYKIFISALLEITDNIVDGAIKAPENITRHDGDDPYLVVAADKGTATFSDIANGLAQDYGFWLDDAFASGGSAGYDHKKMGITARGAWVSVERHFRELGRNIATEPFTAIGVGDMSGDVFGNGMLLSRVTKLIAAFNHLHIFIDPDPDPEASFAERQRLFALPRSTWADYDTSLLSKGGAVFDRQAKSITLTPEIQSLLGIVQERLSPNELIKAILICPADLLWFGGIGTYVKGARESHGDVGDKANDVLRVNGAELNVKVIGEGANLGVTQAGRVEAACHGVRLNTDFIDNSGGVDCSDHEVNIKVLLAQAEKGASGSKGHLARDDRDALLAEMTEEVADLVLMDNYLQTQAMTVALADAPRRFNEHVRLMHHLERAGLVDRALEGLPDEETIAERTHDGAGMTRPEFAVLLAYAKIQLYDALLASDLPDDPQLVEDLVKYFPRPLRKRFAAEIETHPLKREIIATETANSLVNRAGPTFAIELEEKTGMGAAEIARAYAVVRTCFGLRRLWSRIQDGDNKIAALTQAEMMRWTIRLQERATGWFLTEVPQPLDIMATVERFGPAIAEAVDCLKAMVPDADSEAVEARRARFEAAGAEASLALDVARLPVMFAATDIARIAERAEVAIPVAARAYTDIGERLGIAWLRAQAVNLSRPDHWRQQAVIAIIDDLFANQGRLAVSLLITADGGFQAGGGNEAILQAWLDQRLQPVRRMDRLLTEFRFASGIDLAMLAVANRQLRALVEH